MMNLLKIFLLSLIGFFSLLPAMATALSDIQHWSTENGVRVYFVQAVELPMVDVRIVFDAGSARDEANPGLARLTNTLLDSGTEELSADGVAERLDDVGAQLGKGALRDMAWLSLRSLSESQYLMPAVDTVVQLLKEPAFTPESLERERQRMIAAVRGRNQSPDGIAERAFFQALYGEHPYASPPEGNEDSLRAIQREDVQSFHRRYYVAANAVVAIVGDLDRSEAERLAELLVGTLPTDESAPPLPPVQPLAQAQTITIAHPSSQSHVYIGQKGISRDDPDYYSLYLGNHVLGGSGLVSELAEEVRAKRGLSYSVYSYFLPMRQAGPFLMGLQTHHEQADEAIRVAKSTLQGFVENGPDAERLEAARQNIIGGFPLRIDSNRNIVEHLAMIGFYDLPLDFLQTFPANIEATTPEQVTDALRRRIQADRLLTVVVGRNH